MIFWDGEDCDAIRYVAGFYVVVNDDDVVDVNDDAALSIKIKDIPPSYPLIHQTKSSKPNNTLPPLTRITLHTHTRPRIHPIPGRRRRYLHARRNRPNSNDTNANADTGCAGCFVRIRTRTKTSGGTGAPCKTPFTDKSLVD